MNGFEIVLCVVVGNILYDVGGAVFAFCLLLIFGPAKKDSPTAQGAAAPEGATTR